MSVFAVGVHTAHRVGVAEGGVSVADDLLVRLLGAGQDFDREGGKF